MDPLVIYIALLVLALGMCILAAGAAGTPMRACMQCGRDTPVDGRKCRHCGYKQGRV